jgi:hypothetical protein
LQLTLSDVELNVPDRSRDVSRADPAGTSPLTIDELVTGALAIDRVSRSSGSARRVQVRAPAKINLTLRVLGTPARWLHDCGRCFSRCALHDTLTLTL